MLDNEMFRAGMNAVQLDPSSLQQSSAGAGVVRFTAAVPSIPAVSSPTPQVTAQHHDMDVASTSRNQYTHVTPLRSGSKHQSKPPLKENEISV